MSDTCCYLLFLLVILFCVFEPVNPVKGKTCYVDIKLKVSKHSFTASNTIHSFEEVYFNKMKMRQIGCKTSCCVDKSAKVYFTVKVANCVCDNDSVVTQAFECVMNLLLTYCST